MMPQLRSSRELHTVFKDPMMHAWLITAHVYLSTADLMPGFPSFHGTAVTARPQPPPMYTFTAVQPTLCLASLPSMALQSPHPSKPHCAH